jgi:hypothetical protein
MGFRNPIYLDVSLLKNLADYYGIDVPGPRQVVLRKSGIKGKGAGIDKIVTAHIDSGNTVETTETFNTEARPVRLVNDVIDSILASEDAIDLINTADAPLISQSPVQIEGILTVSPATEIGSLMGRFFPLMIAKLAQGDTNPSLGNEDLAQLLLEPQNDGAQVYDLDVVDSSSRRYILILDPKNISEDRDCDDLEGEFTIFGIIDRLLSEKSTLSLSRYLLPGMNRSMRRAINKTSLEELIEDFGKLYGQPIDASALTVTGPGAVIKPLAIY